MLYPLSYGRTHLEWAFYTPAAIPFDIPGIPLACIQGNVGVDIPVGAMALLLYNLKVCALFLARGAREFGIRVTE
jgi:hypothetical protein